MYSWIKELIICIRNRKELKSKWKLRKKDGFKKEKLSASDLCTMYIYDKEFKTVLDIMIWWRLILHSMPTNNLSMSDLSSIMEAENNLFAIMAGKRILNYKSDPLVCHGLDQNHIIHVLRTVPSLKRKAWRKLIKTDPVMKRSTFYYIAEHLPCAKNVYLLF